MNTWSSISGWSKISIEAYCSVDGGIATIRYAVCAANAGGAGGEEPFDSDNRITAILNMPFAN
jgi:hypothetical protein